MPLFAEFWDRLSNAVIDNLPMILALGAAWLELRRRSNIVADKVEVVHKATNSMKDELVEEVRKASFAEGKKSEQDSPTPKAPGK